MNQEYKASILGKTLTDNFENGILKVEFSTLHFISNNHSFKWNLSDCKIESKGNIEPVVYLTHTSENNFSICIYDIEILQNEYLKQYISPKILSKANQNPFTNKKLVYYSLISALVVFTVGYILFITIDKLIENQLNSDTFKKLEQSQIEDIIDKNPKINNITLKSKVDKIFSDLDTSHQLKFHIINNPEVNAFALPYQTIIINSGLIDNATENELSGVIAHEIAHIYLKHHQKRLSYILKIKIVFSIFLNDNGFITSLGSEILNLSHSRESELEADKKAYYLLKKADYETDGLITFFEKILKNEKGSNQQFTNFMSTHPATKDRIIQIQELVKKEKGFN